MKFTLKTTAWMMTAAMAVSALTGCGFMKEQDGASLEINMDNSWRSEKMEEPQAGYTPLFSWGNNILLSRYDGQRTHMERYQYINTETGETIRFEPKSAEERSTASNSVSCTMVIDYGDGSIGMVMCEDNRYDGIIRRCIEIYDAQMNYVRTEEIPEEFHENQYLTGWVDNQGNWYLGTYHDDMGSYTYDCYNRNFEKYGDIQGLSGVSIEDMVWGKEDGTMYACIRKENNDDGYYYEICEVNGAERTTSSTGVFIHPEMIEKYEANNYINILNSFDFVEGSGEYDFCWMDNNGLYGSIDGENSEIVSWINSDFPIGGITSCHFLDNGTVIADLGNVSNHDYYLCTPRTEEEIENTELISLSTLGLFTALENAVIDYNRAENGYRIIVVDYNQYNTDEDDTLGKQKLQEDMLDGIVADMVCTDGMHFESLANKGIFADWYNLMDADESFNREDYLQNFFKAYEYDDKLQRLGVQYCVHSAAAKSEFAGTTEGVSLAEYTAFMDTIPETMDFYAWYSREGFMEKYLKDNMNAFVDAKNAACYFNTSDFAKILEMISALPTLEEYLQMDKETTAKLMPSAVDSHTAFQENRAFIEDVTFCQPIEFRGMNRTTFRDAEVTMIGFPMEYDEGNGGLFEADFTVSVNAQSQQQTAIWDFMKHLLEEEYQLSLNNSMPVHLGALEAMLEETQHMVNASVPFGMGESFIGESNPEEMGRFRTYLEGIRTAYYYNETVYNIMMEEIEVYLAGDCTAEECGNMIQSRVSIYLSEQS